MNFVRVFVFVFCVHTVSSTKNGNTTFIMTGEIRNTAFEEQLLAVQLRTIINYQKVIKPRSWRCSFQDHLSEHGHIPFMNETLADFYVDALNDALNGTKNNLVAGVSSIAGHYNTDFDVLIIWEGLFVNSIEYRDILYGGTKTYHVGIGAPAPTNFFHFDSRKMSYYDMRSCVPFTFWIVKKHQIKKVVMVQQMQLIELRNTFKGVVALNLDADTANMTTASPPFLTEQSTRSISS